MRKRRITVTVDQEALDEALAAVDAGRAESVSAWISDAMEQRRIREQRLHLLSELIADYEAEHGEITDDELAQQEQTDRDAAAMARASVRRAG